MKLIARMSASGGGVDAGNRAVAACPGAGPEQSEDSVRLYSAQVGEVPGDARPDQAAQGAGAVGRVSVAAEDAARALSRLGGVRRELLQLLQSQHLGDRALLRVHRVDEPDRARGRQAAAGLQPRRGHHRRLRRRRCCTRPATRCSTWSRFRCSDARRTPPTRSRSSSPCSSTRTWRDDHPRPRVFLGGARAIRRSGPDFADEHGTSSQRFYNTMCLAYGGDPQTFKEFVDKGWLPKDRAANCAGRIQAGLRPPSRRRSIPLSIRP